MSEKELLSEALKLDLRTRRDLVRQILMTLEAPAKPLDAWPPGFFEAIQIDDPAFTRPEQGQMPPAPVLDPTA
jgi:hypothetical protein